MKSRKYQEKKVSEHKRKGRKQYSDEGLLEFLKVKAQELGRSPRMSDLKEDDNMRNPSTYIRHFGSWNNALKKARLSVNRAIETDKDLLDSLKVKAQELGRSPRIADLKEDDNMRNPDTYIKHFGSWNNALKLAGLTSNKRGCKPKCKA
ncbi:hypothetical protein J6S39_00995 [Candidatus Saccharibacteria bacterium]|nr:hypothetical protein [Candidatus Saccharibacteria bacterium]